MNKSKKPTLSLIAAFSQKTKAIGKDGKLLWRIPGDLERFKDLTHRHTIIVGRKTYDSIGKPLADRHNIILTRNVDFKAPGCIVAYSVADALQKARAIEKHGEIFVIGGGEIYQEFLPLVDRLYLTIVDSDKDGDTYFPEFSHFTTVTREEDYTNLRPPHIFVVLEK